MADREDWRLQSCTKKKNNLSTPALNLHQKLEISKLIEEREDIFITAVLSHA